MLRIAVLLACAGLLLTMTASYARLAAEGDPANLPFEVVLGLLLLIDWGLFFYEMKSRGLSRMVRSAPLGDDDP